MKLKFSNIGKISSAEIDITSISLIAGINNSGKSTAGKLLFGLAQSLNLLNDSNLLLHKITSISDSIRGIRRFTKKQEYLNEIRNISRYKNLLDSDNTDDLDFLVVEEKFCEAVKSLLSKIEADEDGLNDNNQGKINVTIEKIQERLDLPFDSESIKYSQINGVLLNEFSNSLISKYKGVQEATIELFEDNEDYLRLFFENEKLIYDKSTIEVSRDYSSAIYIDDPFILDEEDFLWPRLSNYHRNSLIKSLMNFQNNPNYFEINYQQKAINEIFSNVLDGIVVKNDQSFTYKNDMLSEEIDIGNLSAGMKSFLLIKLLIESGQMDDAEYLILDEPEVHLHPKWQLEYAKLVVLISLNFPIRILITSHSPYFIEALDIYSKQYKNKGIKYYKSVPDQNNSMRITLQEVTESLDEIFEDMYQPLNLLSELRDEIEHE